MRRVRQLQLPGRKACKRCGAPKSKAVKDAEQKAAAGWLHAGLRDTSNRIFVQGFDPITTSEDDLKELFSGIGVIARVRQRFGFPDQWPHAVKIYRDASTGKAKDEAVIKYDDPMAAQSAPGFYDGYELKGKKLSVSIATSREDGRAAAEATAAATEATEATAAAAAGARGYDDRRGGYDDRRGATAGTTTGGGTTAGTTTGGEATGTGRTDLDARLSLSSARALSLKCQTFSSKRARRRVCFCSRDGSGHYSVTVCRKCTIALGLRIGFPAASAETVDRGWAPSASGGSEHRRDRVGAVPRSRQPATTSRRVRVRG